MKSQGPSGDQSGSQRAPPRLPPTPPAPPTPPHPPPKLARHPVAIGAVLTGVMALWFDLSAGMYAFAVALREGYRLADHRSKGGAPNSDYYLTLIAVALPLAVALGLGIKAVRDGRRTVREVAAAADRYSGQGLGKTAERIGWVSIVLAALVGTAVVAQTSTALAVLFVALGIVGAPAIDVAMRTPERVPLAFRGIGEAVRRRTLAGTLPFVVLALGGFAGLAGVTDDAVAARALVRRCDDACTEAAAAALRMDGTHDSVAWESLIRSADTTITGAVDVCTRAGAPSRLVELAASREKLNSRAAAVTDQVAVKAFSELLPKLGDTCEAVARVGPAGDTVRAARLLDEVDATLVAFRSTSVAKSPAFLALTSRISAQRARLPSILSRGTQQGRADVDGESQGDPTCPRGQVAVNGRTGRTVVCTGAPRGATDDSVSFNGAPVSRVAGLASLMAQGCKNGAPFIESLGGDPCPDGLYLYLCPLIGDRHYPAPGCGRASTNGARMDWCCPYPPP